MYTDNAELVGAHVFERSGLGRGPFRFVGCYQDVGPKKMADGISEVGAPGQAMGTCAHCGTGIAMCCVIRSADAKEFVVGSSCVEKTGDAGIIKAYKNSPELRAITRAKAKAKADRVAVELAALIADRAEKLRAIEVKRWDGSMETQLDYLARVIPMCGAAGKARYLKHVKTITA